MAWETRKRGGRYYTRSHRYYGRVERRYIGTGEAGERAATQDAQCRARMAEQRAQVLQERAARRDADEALALYYRACETTLRETLEAAGYRQHDRGEWRLRRDNISSRTA